MPYPVIPGYEITGVLGEGGMGKVYLAIQLSLNRKVAVKILPPGLAADESYLSRFRNEARAAARLRHPNIVQIYDAGEHNHLYFFAMEYVNGETASGRLMRKGKLDEESALLIGESVAVALEYAWDRARLVHRDVKPDNILIDEDGIVKISDLGLAKTMDQISPAITVERSMIGSPHYCAPEQVRGESEIDCGADIYALGATLYHFLTGRPPFAETPGISAMVKKLTDHLPDVADLNPSASDNFAWLVEKMMARDKKRRQRNWHEVLDDFDEVIHGRPPISDPLPAGVSTMLRNKRRAKSLRAEAARSIYGRLKRGLLCKIIAVVAVLAVLLLLLLLLV